MKKAEWTQGGREYKMELGLGGHYRLFVNGSSHPLKEDSANEDYYEFESAKSEFVRYIDDYNDEIAEFIADHNI